MASFKPDDLARKLLDLSKTDGLLDAEKVSGALEALRNMGLNNHIEVVRAYLARIKRAEREQTILIESASELSEAVVLDIKKSMEAQYNRPLLVSQTTNKSLLAGFRLRVGDDVIDASALGRLNALSNKVK
ncbi:MAG: F0F1 ATP synthase subunit delta [Opitutales bacterium]|nr:F0F1 ATP synthase subunit delta [Opitutales bacterium]NRA26085.1 F0F1 ATP synthase subunit delta [Opitutales bacterium]